MVQLSNNTTLRLTSIAPQTTVGDLKRTLSASHTNPTIPFDRLRLVYKGRLLSNNSIILGRGGVGIESGGGDTVNNLIHLAAPMQANGVASDRNAPMPVPRRGPPGVPPGQGDVVMDAVVQAMASMMGEFGSPNIPPPGPVRGPAAAPSRTRHARDAQRTAVPSLPPRPAAARVSLAVPPRGPWARARPSPAVPPRTPAAPTPDAILSTTLDSVFGDNEIPPLTASSTARSAPRAQRPQVPPALTPSSSPPRSHRNNTPIEVRFARALNPGSVRSPRRSPPSSRPTRSPAPPVDFALRPAAAPPPTATPAPQTQVSRHESAPLFVSPSHYSHLVCDQSPETRPLVLLGSMLISIEDLLANMYIPVLAPNMRDASAYQLDLYATTSPERLRVLNLCTRAMQSISAAVPMLYNNLAVQMQREEGGAGGAGMERLRQKKAVDDTCELLSKIGDANMLMADIWRSCVQLGDEVGDCEFV